MVAALLFCAAAASLPDAPVRTTARPDAQSVPAQANEPIAGEARLRRALYYFANGEYQAIAPLLEPLVHQITNEDELVLARETLGTVYFLLAQTDAAREQFRLLLLIRPSAALDPYSTAPPVLRFFAEVKREMKSESDEVARVYAERKSHFQAPRVYEKTVTHRVELLSYFPFGIGQFQNGDTGTGFLFLGMELAFLAVNVTGYILHDLLANSAGVIGNTPGTQNAVIGYTVMQYVGLGAFVAAWAGGAVHARLRFQPNVTTITEKPHVTGGSLLFETNF